MSVLSSRATTRAVGRGEPRKTMLRPGLEGLEERVLLATVTVNASQVVRAVDTQLLGVNVAWWDSNLNTSQTQQMVAGRRADDVSLPRRLELGRFSLQCAPDL